MIIRMFLLIFVNKTITNMGKSILSLSVFLMLSSAAFAQGYYDDMYYTPSEDNEKTEEEVSFLEQDYGSGNVSDYNNDYNVYSDKSDYNSGNTVAGRDVDEYNRRYSYSPEGKDSVSGKSPKKVSESYYVADDCPDEGWVNGFNGSQSDYEYSTRIIRMSNPSLAIHISSPYYWDVVYGSSSFDWNVYVDGNYAYAFPTFSNPLWWDWRFGRYYYGFYNRWYYPYYPGLYAGGYPYYWDSWYYGNYWHHPHYGHYPHYGWHGRPSYYSGNRTYYNNYRTGNSGRTGVTTGRTGTTTARRSGTSSAYGNSVRRSSINSNSSTWRNSSTSAARRSESNSNWNSSDNDRNSFGTSTRRSSSTFNSRSSSSGSSFNNSSTRRSSFSSPSRTGSYNSGRSGYTPSSRSGSRR